MPSIPLDQQFQFNSKTPLFDNLNRLLKAIEYRLQYLAALEPALNAAIDSATAVALARTNETLTPLILDTQARLAEFGANFNAHSSTPLTIQLGPAVLSLDEVDRAGFVFADFISIKNSDADRMIGSVNSYDRVNGQLFVNVVRINGSGPHNSWQLAIATEPNETHESDRNNPHQVTAAQTGAYTIAAVDALLAALSNSAVLKANNLSELTDKAVARVNLGNVPSINNPYAWDKPQSLAAGTLSSGVQPNFSASQLWKATVSGSTFNLLNPAIHPADNTFIGLIITFLTAHAFTFGDQFKVSNYVPSTSGKDYLCFLRDDAAGVYELVGAKNGIML